MSNEDNRSGNKSKHTGRKKRSSPDDDIRWFNSKLNVSDGKWLDDNEDKLVDLTFRVLDAVSEDGRLTIKFHPRSKRWLAILFMPSTSDAYVMDALSMRGATAVDALIVLAYMHFIKFEEAWVYDSPESETRWG